MATQNVRQGYVSIIYESGAQTKISTIRCSPVAYWDDKREEIGYFSIMYTLQTI